MRSPYAVVLSSDCCEDEHYDGYRNVHHGDGGTDVDNDDGDDSGDIM